MYFRMAKLWPSAEQTPFLLKRATDTSGSFQVPGYGDMPTGRRSTSKRSRKDDRGEAVGIPLLKDAAAAGTPRQVQEREIEEVLALPESWCPNPETIVCIKIMGDSMSPILEDGYIVAVDTAQKDHLRLYGQMVAARDPDGGVTIKWFRKVGDDEMLIAQHTSKRHQPIILPRGSNDDHGWVIVGKVLWWIGKPS